MNCTGRSNRWLDEMKINFWNESVERSNLEAGECQLWMAHLDDEDPRVFRAFLSESELARVKRLRDSRSTNRSIVARGILRTLLGTFLECKPEQLVFSYGSHGKPELAGEFKHRLSFNISHSSGLAVFAIAKKYQVGVDIEEVHPLPDLEASASIFLSPMEMAEFRVSPSTEKLDRFFMLWTCKEAISKAIGSGFSGPVKEILELFSIPASQRSGDIVVPDINRLSLLEPANGFAGALACV